MESLQSHRTFPLFYPSSVFGGVYTLFSAPLVSGPSMLGHRRRPRLVFTLCCNSLACPTRSAWLRRFLVGYPFCPEDWTPGPDRRLRPHHPGAASGYNPLRVLGQFTDFSAGGVFRRLCVCFLLGTEPVRMPTLSERRPVPKNFFLIAFCAYAARPRPTPVSTPLFRGLGPCL